MLFSWYVSFESYNRLRGSLGTAVGFMVWIWLSVVVILIGAELNAEMEHQTARDSTEEWRNLWACAVQSWRPRWPSSRIEEDDTSPDTHAAHQLPIALRVLRIVVWRRYMRRCIRLVASRYAWAAHVKLIPAGRPANRQVAFDGGWCRRIARSASAASSGLALPMPAEGEGLALEPPGAPLDRCARRSIAYRGRMALDFVLITAQPPPRRH